MPSSWRPKLSQGSQAKDTVATEAKKEHFKTVPNLHQPGSILYSLPKTPCSSFSTPNCSWSDFVKVAMYF